MRGGEEMFTSIVPLPVSDTEPGPSSFPTLVTHFSCVYRLGRRGERGRRKRKRKRVPCCCSPSVDGAALSVLCSRAARVFLPRAKGKQKTNYKDGAIM